ncbi:MAG TPA: GNAT family N-acetyltransferase [Saprospiraceae bacterium]|nr:GNAT family N-acetyltransferase [Saprospiraceae bacterium]
MNKVNIVRAKRKDCAELASIIEGVVRAIPYYNDLAKENEISKYGTKNLFSKIKEDKDSILLAIINKKIVGFCLTRFDDYLIWIEWFGVVQEYRGQGIATMLLKELDKSILSRNCHKIWCDCRTTNKASIHILSNQGFKQLVMIPQHWYKQDFILWEKLISE